MHKSLGPACLVIAAAAAWGAAHVVAQPKQPAPVPPPKEAPAFTAFPDIRLPMKEVEQNGMKHTVVDDDKLFKRLLAEHPRPVPDRATPLDKVRIHQFNEGVEYLLRVRARTRVPMMCFQPRDYPPVVRMTDEVYRVAAELEPTAAGRVGLAEERVAVLKELERFIGFMVESGTDPPQDRNYIRFHRLQAEADLIQLKEQPPGKK